MIKTGKEHLEQIRDGRTVYIGDEKIKDVIYTKSTSNRDSSDLITDNLLTGL